jgi:hypothetical protein
MQKGIISPDLPVYWQKTEVILKSAILGLTSGANSKSLFLGNETHQANFQV